MLSILATLIAMLALACSRPTPTQEHTEARQAVDTSEIIVCPIAYNTSDGRPVQICPDPEPPRRPD